MAKLTKEQYEKLKKKLEDKIAIIENKIIELEKPNPIGFNYKNRVV